MTKLDAVDQLLAAGRRGLEPHAAESGEVLSRLAAQFSDLPVCSGTNSSVAPHRSWEQPHQGFWSRVKATGAGGTALGTVLVAAGFIAGYAARGAENGDNERAAKVLGVPVETAAGAAPRALPAPAAPLEASPAMPAAPAPSESFAPPAPVSAGPRAAAHRGRPDPAKATKPTAADGLDRELTLLRRAERAVREDNAAFALALLDELDASQTSTQLAEERAATRAMANCRAGVETAAARAHAFLAAHPGSVYAKRVQDMCQLGTASSAPNRSKTAPPEKDGR